MEYIRFRNLDNSEIFDRIIDKNANNILLHQFTPKDIIEWTKVSVKIPGRIELKDVAVRNMNFDLLTNLSVLKELLNLDINYLSIYQFNKPIPDSLQIERLPEESRESILQQNGLEHIVLNELEDTIVMSFSKTFIDKLKHDDVIADRIISV